jgi:hypothetical protein
MTNVTLKPASTQQASLDDLLTLGTKLLTLSLEANLSLIRQAAGLLPTLSNLAPTLPGLPRTACCEIPETECPPYCACDVVWQASPGESPGLTLRLTNAGKVARTFSLQPTPFVGPAASPGTMTVAPTTLTLQPGQTGSVNATFSVPNVPDAEYDAELVIHGAYTQAVCVRLVIRCDKVAGAERVTCEVSQVDRPVRIRAHQWYDHFQCVEPCVLPQRPGTIPGRGDIANPG